MSRHTLSNVAVRNLRTASPRTQHYRDSIVRNLRVLKIAAVIAAPVSLSFGLLQLYIGGQVAVLGVVNLTCAVAFPLIPLLYRFGELIAPLTFFLIAYMSLTFVCWSIGTGSGLQLYFLVATVLVVLLLGSERIVLCSVLAGMAVAAIIALELLVPHDRGIAPEWTVTVGFVSSAVTASLMIFATVFYALRETELAEAAMEAEYRRSESLLTNILPAAIAQRLKDPEHDVIADKYDDASILFADIAGYTKRSSDTSPTDLVQFLDRFYTDLDLLVDRHGLEKVKSSGDSYMVVSGVPKPRPDHLEALACLALDIAEDVSDLTDPYGRAVPLRIGLAAGPVVAGVVGASKFFYDVWGDAVNVAARMESTDVAGRIQVPHNVYERLRHRFVFEERGDVDIKGKGVMHTWYLVGRRDEAVRGEIERPAPAPAGTSRHR